MPSPHTTWTVLPHGELRQLADNLWHVTGSMGSSPLPRAMTVARRGDGGLVLHSAVALDDAGMSRLEALGTPRQLVVPNRMHRMDARIFKDRYPAMQVVGPEGGREAIERVVPVDVTFDGVEPDPAVAFEHLAGERQAEGVMRVTSTDGVTLVFCDTLFNLPHQRGVAGFIVRMLGSTGGPKVTRAARMLVVRDRAALREHLHRLADTPGLKRLVPGHGDVIEENAADVLRAVAAAL